MKFFAAAALLFSLALSSGSQTDTPRPDEISFRALNINSNNGVTTLEGDVRIETSTVVIQADKAVYRVSSRDIQAEGNVHINLK